jgi:hypothetical protein
MHIRNPRAHGFDIRTLDIHDNAHDVDNMRVYRCQFKFLASPRARARARRNTHYLVRQNPIDRGMDRKAREA